MGGLPDGVGAALVEQVGGVEAVGERGVAGSRGELPVVPFGGDATIGPVAVRAVSPASWAACSSRQ